MIDTREESEDEEEEARREEDYINRLRGEEIERVRSQIVCVWGKGKEGSGSSMGGGPVPLSSSSSAVRAATVMAKMLSDVAHLLSGGCPALHGHHPPASI